MRVLVLCTGRTGSAALIKACSHIKNYTAAHESQTRSLGTERLTYPDQHIEADNRLCWHLGQLEERYGDTPYYVHLIRDRDMLAQSFLSRFFQPASMIDAFAEGIHKLPPEKLSREERLQVCYDYIDTVSANIHMFLRNKTNVQVIRLENIRDDFRIFWQQIKAEGDLDGALSEFDQMHNRTRTRKLNLLYRLKLYLLREWRHLRG